MPHIGSFLFKPDIDDHAVCVRLFWRNTERRGQIHMPAAVLIDIDAQLGAVPLDELSAPSAISFGVFAALWAEAPFLIVGDFSAWRPDWGPLQILQTRN